LPWIEDTASALQFEKQINYRVYLGLTLQNKIVEFLRAHFKNEEEIINESYDVVSLASFDVAKVELIDDEGNKTDTYSYLKGSFIISPFTCYLSDIALNNEPDFKNIVQKAKDLSTLYEDKHMPFFKDDISVEKIKILEDEFITHLFENAPLFNSANRYVYIERRDVKMSEELPSFFLNDLSVINDAEEINDALADYLMVNKPARTDIDNNNQAKTDWLDLKKLPTSRWPSPVQFQPYFMQQLSVNVLTSPQSKNKIRSVNGPPGTGKTTLLKDVFADIIVQRATQLIKNKNPFKSEKINGQFFYRLPSYLQGYSIVVASSNNGAVENITRDLTKSEEVVNTKDENLYNRETGQLIEDLNFFQKESVDIANAYTIKKPKDPSIEPIDSWGLISSPLGNTDNIGSLFKTIEGLLTEDSIKTIPHKWTDAVQEFEESIRLVEERKALLLIIIEKQNSLNHLLDNQKALSQRKNMIQQDIEALIVSKKRLEDERETLNELIDTQKASLFEIFTSSGRETKKKRLEYNASLEKTLNSLHKNQQKQNDLVDEKSNLTNQLQKITGEAEKIERLIEQETEDFSSMTSTFFDDYAHAQLTTPYLDQKLQFLRSNVFVAALKVHLAFIKENSFAIASNLKLLKNRRSINPNNYRENFSSLWDTLHLVCPIVSTTFASLSTMYKPLRPGEIGYLVIDEAGQALPQAAVGGIWRARQTIVVGDPIQIEPVMTMDSTIYTDIVRYYGLDEAIFSDTVSVQSIADQVNPYGTLKDEEWIGIPLWVHRRCKQPMFQIANTIAYNNKMIPQHGPFKLDDDLGVSRWIDCKDTVKKGSKQLVTEQIDIVYELVMNHMKNNDKLQKSIFIITPFTEISSALKKKLRNIPDFNIHDQIGTVHTFQGKEAHTVFFIPGLDNTKTGAINWLTSKPNILNVAATRAKDRFIMIGDYELLKKYQYFDAFAESLEIEEAIPLSSF